MKIPKCNWRLEKVYFKAELVDNFKSEYLEWYVDECGHDRDDSELNNFILRIEQEDTVMLYQFPNEVPMSQQEDDFDYFEQVDDNHVIPRKLFNLV